MAKNKSDFVTKIKNKIKNYEFRPIHLLPITFGVCLVVFFAYVFIVTSPNGTVNGDRCDGIMKLEKSVIEQTVDNYTNDKVSSVSIKIECRTVKISVHFIETATIDDAKKIAAEVLAALDSNVDYEKGVNSKYTGMFTSIDDQIAYDVSFVLYGSTQGFPIFGSKIYSSDDINFSDANEKDPALADKLRNKETAE